MKTEDALSVALDIHVLSFETYPVCETVFHWCFFIHHIPHRDLYLHRCVVDVLANVSGLTHSRKK